MATLYLAVYPSAAPAPTWDRVTGWSGSPVYTDADTSPETSGSYTFTPDSSGLAAGTPYVWYAVWDDGSTTVGPVGPEAFETTSAAVDLAITSATHAHTADAPSLTTGLSLAAQNANHAHAADAPALSTGTTLSISDALHDHAATGLDLAASLGLTIQSASHTHIADSAAFSAGAAIEILSANHGHAASVLDLSASLAIVVQDALHAHVADNIELTVPALTTFLSFPGVIDITPTSARPRITITYPA